MNSIPMVIEQGVPSDCSAREMKEQRCYSLLTSLDVPFRRVDHPTAATMEDCRRIETVLGCRICKNLLLTNRQQTDFYLLLMEGEKVFKTKYLSKALGCARLSFASDEQMEALLDITPGSLSVLGLMNDRDHAVRLVIDRPVLDQAEIGMHPCLNTSTLAIATKDLLDRVLPAMDHTPTVVELPEETE